MKNWKERKQVILDLMKNEYYVPMKEKELAIMLQVAPEERSNLKRALEELLADDKIQISKRGKYSLFDAKTANAKTERIIGTFISNQRGFGFVEIDGRQEDLFIPEDKINGAYHLDTVEVALLQKSSGKRQEAQIIKIIERGTNTIVGTFQKSKNFGFVIPDNQKLAEDIFIPIERSKGAVDGHKVVVELTDYGNERKKPEGKIIEIIGHINDPGVDIMSIVKGFDLPVEYPQKVMNQAERIPDEILEADCVGRTDLRDMVMVTIDGEDAKDLDDAVSLTVKDGLYYLGVHIADVSNYVQERSALDREALNRGTSVYLVDRVIPMLPHKLSNGICSLNAGVDRLALSCLMTINEKGEVVDHSIEETVIQVNQRMTYTSVKKILEEKDEIEREQYKELVPMFEQMEELASILRKKRKKRGSIDFDFPETKILIDKEGHPVEIKPYDRNVATKIIEDFMLVANETVAQHFYWLEMPFVYRTHDVPDPEKIQKLASFIYNFGYSIKMNKEEIHPKEIQKLLGKVEGSAEEALISRLALRSMKQAKYTVDCTGHFGLACDYYCHFTSPIRRYPDLQIHRIIKDWIRGRMKSKKIEHYVEILPQVAAQASKLERRAEEAERETNKLKKVEYMEQHIGEIFTGVVSGVTQWGIYVELPNTVEGMVHVSKLPGDYYLYDEQAYEMVGRDTGRKFKLGQTVNVSVENTDKFLRTIDFMIAEEELD
ncbi:MAG: ribonuclease R [Lachnospiraceae bacterium]|nr:ribonuclease R [Lachnospiraceae bacterium]